MASIRFSGTKPFDFYRQSRRELMAIINEEGAQMETELVEATPGDRGRLRQGWTFKPATESRLTAVVGQNSSYFMAVEVGRKPGKGISQKGQLEVAKWAVRKQIVSRQRNEQGRFVQSKAAQNFAYRLSEKYKREGRPGVGFAGLVEPGVVPRGEPNGEPVGGPILAGFQRLRARLR